MQLRGGCSREGEAEHSNGRLDRSREQQRCGTPSSVACSCQADFILLWQMFIDYLSRGGHTTRHSEGHPGVRHTATFWQGVSNLFGR